MERHVKFTSVPTWEIDYLSEKSSEIPSEIIFLELVSERPS